MSATYTKKTYEKKGKQPYKGNKTQYPQRTMTMYSGQNQGEMVKDLKVCDVPELAVGASPVTISTTPVIQLLNGVQIGNSIYNRVGNKIQMKSLHLIGTIDNPQTFAAGDYFRIMVVYDRSPAIASGAGAFPAYATMFSSYDNAGGITSTAYSHMNPNLVNRFVVLADMRYSVPQCATGGGFEVSASGVVDYQNKDVNVNRFIRLKGLETCYTTSTNPAAIGDISTGSLYLVVIGTAPAAQAPYQLTYSARLRYYD